MSTQRGQLTYRVSTSSDHLESGTQFSITVEIANPFEVPVTVKSVSTKLPTEFINVADEQLQQHEEELRNKIQSILSTKFQDVQVSTEAKSLAATDLTKEVLRFIPIVGQTVATGAAVAQFVRASTPTTATVLNEAAGSISSADIQRAANQATGTDQDAEKVRAEIVTILQEKVESLRTKLYQEVSLQPGNSTVQVFTIRTDRSVLFRPASYNLHIEIEYETEQIAQVDVVNYKLAIASSIQSMCVGAVIGCLMGTLARMLIDGTIKIDPSASVDWPLCFQILATMVTNVILAIVGVIVFSRKKDVQPIISIEDFWGSVLTGFLVGYNGQTFFDKILPDPKPA